MADKSTGGRPSIALKPTGPLEVTGLESFFNSRGEAIATRKAVTLCRCGASKNSPFCDGTHSQIGFTDEKSDDRVADHLDRCEGRAITILDNRGGGGPSWLTFIGQTKDSLWSVDLFPCESINSPWTGVGHDLVTA